MTYITLSESSSAGNPNILDNGGFEVWQRGAGPFTLGAFNTYTADRWNGATNGTGAMTVSRESSTIDSGLYSLKINVTSTVGIFDMVQVIENYQAYASKTISLSIRVWSNISGPVIQLSDGITSTTSNAHTGGSTWQTLSLTKKMSASTSGMTVIILLDGAASTGPISTTYWDSAIMVIGSQPVTFVPMNLQDDLARCQRYYYRITGPAFIGVGEAVSASQVGVLFQFPVNMRATPSLSFTGIANITGSDSTGGAHAFTSLSNLGFSTEKNYSLSCTGASGLAAGNASWVAIQNSSGFIEFSADI